MAQGTVSVRINYTKVRRYVTPIEKDMCKKAADATQKRVKKNIEREDRIDSRTMIDSIRVEKTNGPNYRVIGRTPYIGYQEHGRPAVYAKTVINGRLMPMNFFWRKKGKYVSFFKVAADEGGHFFADARDQIRLGDFL